MAADNKKRALILNLAEDDLLFVDACKKLEVDLVALSAADPREERLAAKSFFHQLPFYEFPSAFDRQIPPLSSRLLYLQEVKRIIKKHQLQKILKLPRYFENRQWALKLARALPVLQHKLPLTGFNWDKSCYLPKLIRAGLPVPKIYKILKDQESPELQDPDIVYPCICKPACCSGGVGVMVADSPSDLPRLFGPELHPEHFNDINLFYRNRIKKNLRNYLYNSGHLGGSYLIQEFVKGEVLSVSGTVINGSVEEIFCYGIGTTSNKYCAEQSFTWPLDQKLENRLRILSQQMVKVLKYSDGPFMADMMLSEHGELSIIDAAPRASITGARLSFWVFQDNLHAEQIIASHWSQRIQAPPQRQGRAIFWQRFPFPKGKLKNIKYPDFNQDYIVHHEICLREGDQINEPRLDRQMAERGALVTTGNTLTNAEENWNNTFKQIEWSLYE
jgi:hypothetical protein